MKDVVLTGFMGTGKTTVGRILADRLGRSFVDTDEEIERRAGMSVSAIFSRLGEDTFRRIERDVISNLGPVGGRIIATGGGALLNPENRASLSSAVVVCLAADPDTLERRLATSDSRPLLAHPTTLYRLLEERQQIYELFPQVRTDERGPEEVADDVARAADLPISVLMFPGKEPSTVIAREGMIDDVGELLAMQTSGSRVLLVTDGNLNALGWRARAVDSLRSAGFAVSCVVLPVGEESKSLDTIGDLYGECVASGLDRSDTVVGLGGGVVGDVAGFLAATYMRGVRLALLPTTLLAQVDASIGGKTGIDAEGIKNLVGAFHPAGLVAIDPLALATLGPAHLADGMAEVLKVALMRSEPLLRLLDRLDSVHDIASRQDITWAAVRLKADLIRRDPYERGERALLNYGHTVGHALEAASDYRESHGRCVGAGMFAETRITAEADARCHRVTGLLQDALERFGLPTALPEVDPLRAREAAAHDKKSTGGRVRVAVPVAPGEGRLTTWSKTQLEKAVAVATGRPV